MPGSFIDTNVLVYFAAGDEAKADRAEAVIADGGTISVQVLNELANVARRKLLLSWQETHDVMAVVRGLLRVRPNTVETHKAGLALAERYGFSLYDAMIVAAALEADCTILWSEDLQDGLAVDGSLRVGNPFRSERLGEPSAVAS